MQYGVNFYSFSFQNIVIPYFIKDNKMKMVCKNKRDEIKISMVDQPH